MSTVFSFPNPVNEKAARVVAAGVAMKAAATLVTGWHWLLVVLAVGFLLRVLAGPRWSPLGQLATKVVAPRLGPPRLVPGPPKRFAQSVGLVFSTSAAVISLAFGERTLAAMLVGVLLVFALLESIVGVCAGCWGFRLLMRAGVIPAGTCEACLDIWGPARHRGDGRRAARSQFGSAPLVNRDADPQSDRFHEASRRGRP